MEVSVILHHSEHFTVSAEYGAQARGECVIVPIIACCRVDDVYLTIERDRQKSGAIGGKVKARRIEKQSSNAASGPCTQVAQGLARLTVA